MKQLDIDRIEGVLGAKRIARVNVSGGYFGALQLVADIERIRYLEKLAQMQTPKELDTEDSDVCDDYCQVGDYAKTLLNNPNDERSAERLSQLVEKLKI